MWEDEPAEEDDRTDDDADTDEDDDGDEFSSAHSQESNLAHRTLVAEILQKLAARGFDPYDLAEQAGVPGSDPELLEADDLGVLTLFLSRHFPDVVEALYHRHQEAQDILDDLAEDGGDHPFGGIGKLF